MVAPEPVNTIINPNNSDQRYHLWGNGRIDALGGAPPITALPYDWYGRPDQPVGVAIHILNWATGAGYVLDKQGGFQPLNGAPVITSTGSGGALPTNNNGLTYVDHDRYVGWSWNPDASGQGYACDHYGEIFEFGGAPDAPRTGPRFTTPTVRGFEMQWTPTKKAYMVDAAGAVWADFGATFSGTPAPYFGRDVTRDLAISDWSNGSGYVLTGDGATHAFGTAQSPLTGGPYRKDMDLARTLEILSVTPLKLNQVHSGGESFDYFASTPPTATAGGMGVNEAQLVTITGSPTGGTFTLTYSGQTTAAIARNATASAVQTALRALTNIGSTGVTVTGGPGPGTPWTVTFTGTLAATDVPLMTASGALLTGGTTPTVTVTLATAAAVKSPAPITTSTTQPLLAWAYSDPQSDAQAGYEVYLFTQAYVTANAGVATDPTAFKAGATFWTTGTARDVRGVVPDVDLVNGTWRFYVRVMDSSEQWSPWSTYGWTQNVPVPPTPSAVTGTLDPSTTRWRINLSATTTSSVATHLRFDSTDDNGVTWTPVRGASAVPRLTTTTAVDYDIPLGVDRRYRATAFATAPRTASLPSSSSAAVHTSYARLVYVLTHTEDAALGGEVRVVEAPEWSREQAAGVFRGTGAKFPVVVQDGVPKAQTRSLTIETNTRAEYLALEQVVMKPGTLLLRDQFGAAVYCRVAGAINARQVKLPALPGELTQDRHNHRWTVPLVEVAQP